MTQNPILQDIRPSPIAGRWYPGTPAQLTGLIDELLAQAEVAPITDPIMGMLVPHAGYRYSGPVAAHAFKLVQGQSVDVVALIGPSHYPYPAAIVTTAHDAYETPLGRVRVDHDLLAALGAHVSIHAIRHDPEHSLEIELPFLQHTLGAFDLVPLALIDQSYALAERLGQALAEVLDGKNALLVASSDLSHFYPQPVANRFDHVLLDAVAAFDPARVVQAEDEGQSFACGRGAIAAVMIAARALGANSARVVEYATSGDVTHEYDRVVGYGAAVFCRCTNN